VLWRVYHDELDGFDAEQIVLIIGTINLHLNAKTLDPESIMKIEVNNDKQKIYLQRL